jgi:hypothetical protein
MLRWIVAVVTGVVPMGVAPSFGVVRIAADTIVVMRMAMIMIVGFGLCACFGQCCLHEGRVGQDIERDRHEKRQRSERCERSTT